MDFVKKTGDTIHIELPVYAIDFNYLKQYKIPVVAGRSFSGQFAGDTLSSMLINESAEKNLGFSSAEDAIGVKAGMYPENGKIIGVYKDFHFESLQNTVAPLAIRIIPFKYRLFSVQLNPINIKKTIPRIDKEWKDLVPERPLEYSFLNIKFNSQYQSAIKFGQVFTVFTALAIVIACLGLFGLTLFSVQQRTKEIGIRKILGASVASITTTISKDFFWLVVIAILIASPVAWYLMHHSL